jgi:ethanolamine transporter EutH
MLQVQGRSDLLLRLEIIKKTIAIGPLLMGVFWGIIPMLWGSLLVGLISFFLNSYYSGKFLGYSSMMQLIDIAPSYCIATIIALSVWFLKYLPISNWIILPLQIIVGSVVFFAVCRLTKMEEYSVIKGILGPAVKRIIDSIKDGWK